MTVTKVIRYKTNPESADENERPVRGLERAGEGIAAPAEMLAAL